VLHVYGLGPPPTTGYPAYSLSRGRPAWQSSTLPCPEAHGCGPQLAVDGSVDGNFWDGSVTHTDDVPPGTYPWWEVDLGRSQPIGRIDLWNRNDHGLGLRLSDFWVFVSPNPFGTDDTPLTLPSRENTWSSHVVGQAGSPSTIPVYAMGRYVRVQLSNPGYLSLAEVQVYGDLAGGRGAFATQSSTLASCPAPIGGCAAGLAVDGQTSGNFWAGSVTHTNEDLNAWWQIDLGASLPIGRVDVWNRTDCCGTRLSDFYVFVSASEFQPTDTPTTLVGRPDVWSYHVTGTAGAPSGITLAATGPSGSPAPRTVRTHPTRGPRIPLTRGDPGLPDVG
jgi:hypothetical protein